MIGLVAAVVAALLIWLVVSEPVAALLIWLVVSVPVALLIGRVIALADRRSTSSPPAARSGEEARRRGHLHLV